MAPDDDVTESSNLARVADVAISETLGCVSEPPQLLACRDNACVYAGFVPNGRLESQTVVLSIIMRIDGEWLPWRVGLPGQWLELDEGLGVVGYQHLTDNAAAHVEFSSGASAAVRVGDATYAFDLHWGLARMTDETSIESTVVAVIYSDGERVMPASPKVAVSAAFLAERYLRELSTDGSQNLATQTLLDLVDADPRGALAVLAYAADRADEAQISSIGAGPLESLIHLHGHSLLEPHSRSTGLQRAVAYVWADLPPSVRQDFG